MWRIRRHNLDNALAQDTEHPFMNDGIIPGVYLALR